jgi:hypothetical protein
VGLTSFDPPYVCWFIAVVALLVFAVLAPAATLTVVLDNADRVASVGAFRRWDEDGNPRRAVNPKAAIDKPETDATAAKADGNRWVFSDLPAGKYDLVIMLRDRVRIEGWEYAPVLEFDRFFPPAATTDKKTRGQILDDIRQSRHYENKVVPLALGGDRRAMRVLVMLIRDLPTSYTKGAGTLRFEIWQYTWTYGAWVKEKRTRVMHRLLLPVKEMRQWTWVWEPALGAIDVKQEPVTVKYAIPKPDKLTKLPGLKPY